MPLLKAYLRSALYDFIRSNPNLKKDTDSRSISPLVASFHANCVLGQTNEAMSIYPNMKLMGVQDF